MLSKRVLNGTGEYNIIVVHYLQTICPHRYMDVRETFVRYNYLFCKQVLVMLRICRRDIEHYVLSK